MDQYGPNSSTRLYATRSGRATGYLTAFDTCLTKTGIIYLDERQYSTFGTVAGSMLPFVLRRIGFDPATSSAPFVATLVDVTGLVIYFTVGSVILRGTLL